MNTRPLLTLVAAVSRDGYISTGRGVPWDLPRDRAHFRRLTAGQWLLLGRHTYEEMLGWFHHHHPLVLTRAEHYQPPVGEVVRTVEEALERAAQGGACELFVCGGSGAYAAAMPWADRLVMTEVDILLGGGVSFPPIIPGQWQLSHRENFPADSENALGMVFSTYQRANPAQTAALTSHFENSKMSENAAAVSK